MREKEKPREREIQTDIKSQRLENDREKDIKGRRETTERQRDR